MYKVQEGNRCIAISLLCIKACVLQCWGRRHLEVFGPDVLGGGGFLTTSNMSGSPCKIMVRRPRGTAMWCMQNFCYAILSFAACRVHVIYNRILPFLAALVLPPSAVIMHDTLHCWSPFALGEIRLVRCIWLSLSIRGSAQFRAEFWRRTMPRQPQHVFYKTPISCYYPTKCFVILKMREVPNARSTSLLANSIILIILSTMAVIMRAISRRISVAKLWWDDVLILIRSVHFGVIFLYYVTRPQSR